MIKRMMPRAHGFAALYCLMALPFCYGDETAVSETAPARQLPVGSFSTSFPSPIPGLPVPMDLKAAEGASLSEVDITMAVRQHEIMLLYSFVIDWPEKAGKTTLPVGIPFRFNQSAGTNADYAPIHRLPAAKAIRIMQVGSNGILMEHALKNGFHPQKDAPSLRSIADANYWIEGRLKLNPGRNVITFNFIIPAHQTITGSSGRQAQTSVSPRRLDLNLTSAAIWGNTPHKAALDIYSEEMLPTSLKILGDDRPLSAKADEKGVIRIDLLNPDGRDEAPKQLTLKYGSELQFAINAEDLPDRIERVGTMLVNGKRLAVTSNYTASASSTTPIAANGEPASADNLKRGRGFWAEETADEGNEESISLSLNNPQKLVGLIIQSGASPIILGRNDPEALRHPDVAFSLYNRPRVVTVSVNDGEYSFRATLRDDWNPQLIEVPYFNKTVKTIKVTLGEVYQGSNGRTHITTILPVVR